MDPLDPIEEQGTDKEDTRLLLRIFVQVPAQPLLAELVQRATLPEIWDGHSFDVVRVHRGIEDGDMARTPGSGREVRDEECPRLACEMFNDGEIVIPEAISDP